MVKGTKKRRERESHRRDHSFAVFHIIIIVNFSFLFVYFILFSVNLFLLFLAAKPTFIYIALYSFYSSTSSSSSSSFFLHFRFFFFFFVLLYLQILRFMIYFVCDFQLFFEFLNLFPHKNVGP